MAAARLPVDWVEVEQQPPPFNVERLFPEAEAGSLVGTGGTSKSTIKIWEGANIILGRDLYGRRVLRPGPVLCISKEDRAETIDYRLKRICRGMGLSDVEMRAVHKNFLRLDLRGDAFMLQRINESRMPFRTGDVDELAKAFEGEGIVNAWFDTASRFGTGESNQEAAVMLDAGTVIADAWRAAVEFVHHVSQGIARTALSTCTQGAAVPRSSTTAGSRGNCYTTTKARPPTRSRTRALLASTQTPNRRTCCAWMW